MALNIQNQAFMIGPQFSASPLDPIEDEKKLKDSNQTQDTDSSGIEEALKAYEKARLQILEKLISAANDSNKHEVLSELSKNPLWKALQNPAQSTNDVNSGDMKNFFFLIFKVMDKNNQSSNLDLASLASHVLSDLKINDEVTVGSQGALADMKHDVEKAYKKEHSLKGEFLKIFIPLIVTVAAIAISVLTLGSGTGASAGVEAGGLALDGSIEALGESGSQAFEMTSFAEAGGGEGVSGGAGGSSGAASSSASQSTQGFFQSAKNLLWSTWQSKLATGVLATSIGIGGSTPVKADALFAKDYSDSLSIATTTMQGKVSVGSSAANALQNDMQQTQSKETNETENQQEALQIKQQAITAMMSVYSLGQV